MRKMAVYSRVPLEECWKKTKRKPIQLRWVDTRKSSGEVRSRLVAKEFKNSIRPELFAATPPLEALKMILSLVASAQISRKCWEECIWAENRHTAGGEGYGKEAWADNAIGILHTDVARAYFHAPSREDKFVYLPPEDWQPGDEDQCCRLNVSLYGTRDAAKNWEQAYVNVLTPLGFVRGKASPCIFRHRERALRVIVHGDDFVA